jgi:tetratricopeptide (TPR) repeat protein
VISLDATNCRTGDTIEKTQVQAPRKDDVLRALGEAAGQLRRNLGESLASIGKYDAPIQDATTASLDALKSYSVGLATRRRQGDAASMPFLRKAIEQDPDFALAHARLSTVYGNLNEGSAAREQITKAFALRDRVSEPERLYIEARYATIVEGSVQKAIEAYSVWTQTYPNDFVPHSNLAGAYEQRGDHERAIDEYKTAIRLAPDEPLPYANLAGLYESQHRPDEARRTIEEAIARGLDSIGFRGELYSLAFFRGDEAEMARQVAAAQRLAESFRMLGTQAYAAMYQGRLARARELCEQFTTEATSRTGLNGAAANLWSNLAQGAAIFGDAATTRASIRRAFELERNLGTLLNSAYALVVLRDTAEAQRLAAEAATLPGAGTPDAQTGFKLIAALVKERHGDRAAADALPPPRSDEDISGLFAAGVANLDAGNADVAAQRFETILKRAPREFNVLRPVTPLYYARALAKLGRADESRKAYDEFFDAFKHADPTLPIVVAARAESARLKTGS